MKKREKTPNWARLDNAAKIFPPSSSKRDTKVFRFSCFLKEKIEQELLEQALEQALKEFPLYRSVLKQGAFWNYFEHSSLKAEVKEENEPPCQPLYHIDSHTLLFEVTYYKQRINLEIYHALTDGTGALQFLKTIVYYYLLIAHPDLEKQQVTMDYDASTAQKQEDSFQKYYDPSHCQKEPTEKAYRVRATFLPEGRLRVLEGVCSTKAVLRAAHELNTTMTVYLTAALLCAIAKDMPLRERKKRIVLCVPVNLRSHFSSETARNFFSVMNVGYCFDRPDISLEDVIQSVQKTFEEELKKEKLANRINQFLAIEHNPMIRIVPLPIKRLVLRFVHNRDRKRTTGAISNIGRITMPPELTEYIERFEVFVSTLRIQTCICSFEDNLTITFTAPFASTEIQKNFFRILTKANVPVEIIANVVDEE